MSNSVAKDVSAPADIRTAFVTIQQMLANFVLTNPTLAIKGAGEGLAKNTEPFYAIVDGTVVLVADNTDMAALAGTVTADKFNVYVFSIDSAGTPYTQMGTEGDTLGAVVFPVIPTNRAVVGFVIINPTGTGNFVGGTTDLDDATVVPNAVYVNTPYPFNPLVMALPKGY